MAAEFRKKRDGFVSLGGAYAEPSDVDVARVSKIVRSTMTRLHAELMRSISHYRAQQQGSAPERVFLCGGSASTPYMREFFHEKLQLPIEFFNPLRNVAVADTAPVGDIARSAHLLGEVVGLALRTATTCPMELNLRPASVVRRQELEKRRPFFIAAAACFLLALIGWGFYYTRAAHVTQRATQRLQEKIDMMRAAEAQLDKLRKQAASIDSLATPLVQAINDRSFWVELIEDLNVRLPKEDIWITELIPMSAGKPIGVDEKQIAQPASTPIARSTIKSGTTGPAIDGLLVRGLYLFNPRQQEVVVDYFRNLVGSRFFSIDPNNQARVIKPTTPNDTEWAFPYELHLDLKKGAQADFRGAHAPACTVRRLAERKFAKSRRVRRHNHDFMTDWFRENRWLGTFLIVLGLGALLSLYFLFSAKSSADDAVARFSEAAAERGRLERLDPFPSEANYRKMKVHLENYAGSLEKLKEQLKVHVLPAAPLAPNEFQSRLRQAMLATSDKARANKVKLPDNFALGFEAFTTSLPDTAAAPVLGQELAQAELLMNILIDARVDGVTMFKRTELSPPGTAATTAQRKPALTTGPRFIERGIVDLTFVAAPSVTRRVLNQMASSPQQFYIMRTLHIKNDKDKGPPREQAAQPGAVAQPPPAKAASNAALNFIVGNEHIETSARIEMVRFTF